MSDLAGLTVMPHSLEAEMGVLGSMLFSRDRAGRVALEATEEMFWSNAHRAMYACFKRLVDADVDLAEQGASSLIIDDLRRHKSLEAAGGVEMLDRLYEWSIQGALSMDHYLTVVKQCHGAREVIKVAQGIIQATVKDSTKIEKILDRALTRFTHLVVETRPIRTKSQADIIAAERARIYADPNVDGRVTLPFQKLRHLFGDFLPGDAIGIPGFSNSGKTTFVGALCDHWAMEGKPACWFPTESAERFLSRVACARAQIDQRFAERGMWAEASVDQRESYEMALDELARAPIELCPQRNITPQEIIAQVSLRRRRWDDQPVVVVIDHMHRLNYGGLNPAFAVGDSTKMLRDWAGENNVILVMLYQPKKPDVDINVYKPVSGYGIAGSGQVMAELDIIMSPYRRWVQVENDWQTNPAHRTYWGTPKCVYKDGHPVAAKPDAPGAKVDDEHVYVKATKRRTGGEGPTVMLNIDAPSGHIFQLGLHDDDGGHRHTA